VLDDPKEMSDLIVSYDPVTLARRPVRKDDVVRYFAGCGNRRAVRIVEAMPESAGILDPDYVDRLLVAVHCEIQRISEEFEHGQRVAELLRPILATLREVDLPRPFRVVDLGCGTGFVVRWLARYGNLGADTTVIGVDYNRALIAEADRLAKAESLPAEFLVANAFRLAVGPTLLMTTGVIHHFRGDDLISFFREHDQKTVQAFAHFDFQPSPLAPLGAWLFHAARMRQPLAKHDGVLSAVRAHPGTVLLDAARAGAPSFAVGLYGTRFALRIPRSFHTLIGLRPTLTDRFVRNLGPRAGRLGELR
jgi:SAM-dependent methyltransferase